jgi:hypothetical protein
MLQHGKDEPAFGRERHERSHETTWGYREARPASRGGSQQATLSKPWIIELEISRVGRRGTPVRQSLGAAQTQELAEGGLG